MRRKVMRRITEAAATLAVAMTVAVTPGVALAAPQPPAAVARQAPAPLTDAPKNPAPDAVKITGPGLAADLVVGAKANPDSFQALLTQVSWLAGSNPTGGSPDKGKLGDKYVVTVQGGGNDLQTYDMYPSAAGGPRAFRPGKQPTGKTTEGWFYARLNLSETMRISGVPLPEQRDLTGGTGGGERVEAADLTEAEFDAAQMLTQLRELVLLNGAVALIIAIGLGGMSYLIRRKV